MRELTDFERAISLKVIKICWLAVAVASVVSFAIIYSPYTKGTVSQVVAMTLTFASGIGFMSILYKFEIANYYLKYFVNLVLIIMTAIIIVIMNNPEMFNFYYFIMAINTSYRDRVLHLTSSFVQVISYLLISIFFPTILPAATAEDSTISLLVTRITTFFIVALLIDLLNHYTSEVRVKLLQKDEEVFRSAFSDSSNALIQALEIRDEYTRGHAFRTSCYAKIISKCFDLTIPEDVFVDACLLHDIGKIGISDVVLTQDKKLTEEDVSLIKKHPEMGSTIISSAKSLQMAIPMVLYHHERYDGNGYPKGLKGAEIPLEARILALADAFDAMTSDRPYRKRLTLTLAINEIREQTGKQFCPKVVEAFFKVEDEIYKTFKNYL